MAERVLVTGATGFVGRAVCRCLAKRGYHVRGLVRGDRAAALASVELVNVGNVEDVTAMQWAEVLDDVQVVIHCAALVHQMSGVDDPNAYYRVNTVATAALAEASATAGVRRFVFLSTVKVLGEYTDPGRPFRADDPAAPQDDYARSKWLAEQALSNLHQRTEMDTVIFRPPLIYGPGVGGNFQSLMRLVATRVPLPFGAVHNKRSLLALPNLTDLLERCVAHESELNDIYMVSDGKDISTTELIQEVGRSQGVAARLWSIPSGVIQVLARLSGRRHAIDRLLGNLQVDIERTQRVFCWTPKYSIAEVLSENN